MAIAIMFLLMFLFFAIGVPIGISLILPCFILLLMDPLTSPEFLAQTLFTGTASFTMIALPFFMICGNIMDIGGISKRLVRVAKACVGNVTGSLGMVAILACMFFGAVSGSAVATVAAIGIIMIPEMVRNGYDKYYATGLCAVAGGLGIIVPPSYPMVIYGVTNNESIGKLFIAGIIPALVVGLILMIVNFFYCKKRNIKGTNKFSVRELVKAFWAAKLALLMPVIILGGIYGGIFTATEAAVVATVYGIIVGVFVYREVSFKNLWRMFAEMTTFSGGMMLTVAPAAALSTVFAYLGVTKSIAAFFMSMTTSPIVILLLVFVILFIIGMFVQTTPAIVIFSPVLLAVVSQIGISTLHFGIIMTVALALAFVTPPVCANIFVAQTMTGLSMDKIVKSSIPFVVALSIALLIIMFSPWMSELLPKIL
ncbi:MAG: TRAP transporter large permease [Treponemataceae bacterium]